MTTPLVIDSSGAAGFLGRYTKPSFQYSSSSAIKIPASTTKPAYFIIDGKVYQITSDIECVMTSLAASKVYYLYATDYTGVITLVYDATDPEVGPAYGKWTYIGAFRTNSSSQIDPFLSLNGSYATMGASLGQVSTTGATSFQTKTIVAPAIAKYIMGRLQGSGAGIANDAVQVTGSSLVASSNYELNGQVDSIVVEGYVSFPVVTGTTIYIRTTNAANTALFDLMGWMEDPSEWK